LLKINLGAGLTVKPDWINIDGSINALIASWPKYIQKFLYKMSGSKQNYSFQQYSEILKNNNFICHDLTFGIPLIDNCADYIFCSHLLEHLTKQQGVNLIKEMYRVLKEEGMVRIVVPDLAYAIDLYCKGEKEESLKRFYNDEGNQSELSRHKYMYDFDILKSILTDTGFTVVTRCQCQHGKTPDIDFLDKWPQGSLYVEAARK
jgi:predicted SAM-dependent methyltransferase